MRINNDISITSMVYTINIPHIVNIIMQISIDIHVNITNINIIIIGIIIM